MTKNEVKYEFRNKYRLKRLRDVYIVGFPIGFQISEKLFGIPGAPFESFTLIEKPVTDAVA